MTWIALRRVKLRGTQYEKGEEVPGADLRNRRMLVATGYIVDVPDAPTAPPPPNLREMKRAELEAYAADRDIANPADFANMDDLRAAIEAAERSAVGGPPTTTTTTTAVPATTTTTAAPARNRGQSE
jgi:hypothetical protein